MFVPFGVGIGVESDGTTGVPLAMGVPIAVGVLVAVEPGGGGEVAVEPGGTVGVAVGVGSEVGGTAVGVAVGTLIPAIVTIAPLGEPSTAPPDGSLNVRVKVRSDKAPLFKI